jgi:transcriptional regulator with XRE-family HTH domain
MVSAIMMQESVGVVLPPGHAWRHGGSDMSIMSETSQRIQPRQRMNPQTRMNPLARLRIARGMSQVNLARTLGVGYKTLCCLESGQAEKIPAYVIDALRELGVDEDIAGQYQEWLAEKSERQRRKFVFAGRVNQAEIQDDQQSDL